jgi:hypothetical protein
MSRAGRSADRIDHPVPFPASIPAELNYVVLTGTVAGNPKEHRGPAGDPVVLFKIEFSVSSPMHPRLLWTHASFEVEVPEEVGQPVEELRDGSSVLVSGRLSERLAIGEDGSTGRRGVILAALVKPGLPPGQPEASRC